MSPKTTWIADGWLPRMPESLDELDGLLLTVPTHRIVQRDGIHFQGQHYLSPTPAPFVGRTITIRYDPATCPRSASTTTTPSSAPRDEAHPNQRLTMREIETARRARRRQLRKDVNDRIPTTAHQEKEPPPPPTAAPHRRRLRTYEEDD